MQGDTRCMVRNKAYTLLLVCLAASFRNVALLRLPKYRNRAPLGQLNRFLASVIASYTQHSFL